MIRAMHFEPVWRTDRNELGRRHRASRFAYLMVLSVALLVCALPQAASAESGLNSELGASTELGASAEPEEISTIPSTTSRYSPCPSGSGLIAECNLVIDPVPIATSYGYQLPDGAPLIGSGEKGGLDPADLQSAYKLPTTGGSGETVALVDAYGDSTAESDLNEYRAKYKVYYKGTETACTKANEGGNGCFKKVNVKGEETNYPEAGPAVWGAETALDIEMVSAACPECHILLVEANGEYPAETAAAVEEAAKLKATEISNSYGYSEDDESACPSKKGCQEYLAAYNQSVPVTASAGDGGYDNKNRGYAAPLWPAVSPNVIAVGGTELEKVEKPKEGERAWKEVVWPESGGGCSLYESEPAWQEVKAVPKACGTKRTDNDVASVAEGVSIYTTPYEGGWGNVGGTSASSPFIAGVEAHATSPTKKLGADAFYKKPSMLFHISQGSNGSCGAEGSETYYLCHATKEGYNGPTGWGTPDGVFTTTGPSAVTEPATGITKIGATLNGTVNPNSVETKYYFEYGTLTSYGSKTTEVSAGSGSSNVEVNQGITGLTAGKQYDFRIVATNSNKETSEGSNQVFRTLPNAPENTGLPVASPETPDQAVPESATTGTWTNEPTGYTYHWERCNASGGECKEITGATSSTYTPDAEDVEHTLVAKVTATNSGGSTSARSKASNSVQPVGHIIEYSLPAGSEPNGIAKGPDGNVWFTDRRSSKIGKITPSGSITEYSLPKEGNPREIAAGSDGNLWFTIANPYRIGKITTSGTITEYLLSGANGLWGIVSGPDGDLWFAEGEHIGKITTSGTITEYALPSERSAGGITKGPDGNLWFTESKNKSGTANSWIGKITTSGAITEYVLPEGSEPGGITAGPDGNLWFTETGSDKVGKITTSGKITEYSVATGESTWPRQIMAGADGNLWFTDWGYDHSKIERITTEGVVTAYELEGFSYPAGITTGPEDNLWFAKETAIGKITP